MGRPTGMTKRKMELKEERDRILELEEYFAGRRWEWKWSGEVNVQTRKTRKMIKDEHFMLIRPTLYKEV